MKFIRWIFILTLALTASLGYLVYFLNAYSGKFIVGDVIGVTFIVTFVYGSIIFLSWCSFEGYWPGVRNWFAFIPFAWCLAMLPYCFYYLKPYI